MNMRLRLNVGHSICCIAVILAGCDVLDVSDPTAVEEADVATATGADLLRLDAVSKLSRALSEAVVITGILSDELVGREEALDMRDPTSNAGRTAYTMWNQVRHAASLAIPQIRASGEAATKDAHIAEMHALRGFATLNLAESFCAGFPLHDVVDLKPIYGAPLTTAEVVERAAADLDSALALSGGNAQVTNFGRVAKGRALVALGKFTEAAAAVQAVPSDFALKAEFTEQLSAQSNFLGRLWKINQFIMVGQAQGMNGIDYPAAADPRLEVTGFFTFGTNTFYKAAKYADGNAPILVASGIEARLIEAEAALHATDIRWLGILNDLRATRVTPSLLPLADPGSDAARLDLIMRERAFWLYGTAHRLGDMRRLVTGYGRAANDVYPNGTYYAFGVEQFPRGPYGTATALRFPVEVEATYSPSVTGCTDQ